LALAALNDCANAGSMLRRNIATMPGRIIHAIATETGISREQLMQYLSQEISLDHLARAFFFYYFLNKYGEE